MDNSADHVASTRRQRARNHQRSPSASGHAASPRKEESNRLFPPCSSSGRRKGNAEEKKLIVEGKVRIQGAEHNEVFYNPVQVFNRDLSIVAIKAFAEMQKEEIRRRGARALDRIQSEGKPAVTPLKFVGFNVVEPLAATGLRSLRYLVELEGVVKSVVANDMDPHAVATMKKNAALNGVSLAHLFVTCTEATRLLYGLAFPANISHGTLKKLCSLPAGSSVPHTFDLTPLHAGLPSVPLSLFLHEEACRQQAQQQQTQRQGPEKQHQQQEMQQQQDVRASAGLGGAAEPHTSPSTNPLFSAGDTPRAETTHVAAAAAAADHSAAASPGATSCAASLPPPPPPRPSAAGVAAAAQGAAAGETTGRAGVEGEAASAAPAGSEEEEGKGLCDGLPVCFDIVDIDPYGSVSPFLDAAIQAVRPGGLLCLTSTDMPVLCGNAPETTFYKYGGAAVKAKYIHEMALRLIIYAASSSAAKYKKVVVPLLACSVDFYVRVFLQAFDSAERCRDFHSQAAIVQQCVACDAFRVLPLGSVAAGAAADGGGAEAAAGEGETAAAGGGVGGGGGGQAAAAGGGGRAEGGEEEVRELQKAEPGQESQQTQQQEKQQSPAGPERKQQEDSAGRQLGGESAEEKRPKDGAQRLVETTEECEKEGKAKKKTEEEKRRSAASNKRRRAAYFPADMTPCCSECGQRTLLGGPFYAGPLYQQEFVEKCLNICASAKEHLPGITMGTRITGVLTAIKQELREVPLFYHLPSLCQKMRLEMLRPAAVRAALVRLGYKVSHFHRDPQAIKTDASSTVVFDILRTHAQRHPPAHGANVPLLMKEITTKGIDMTRLPPSENAGPNIPRWLPNPTPHWGPKSRACSKKARTETCENGYATGKGH